MIKEKDLMTIRKNLIQKVGFSQAVETVVTTLRFLDKNGYEIDEEKEKELQSMLLADKEEGLKELIELAKHYRSIMEE